MVTGRSAQSKRRGRETRSGLATFASFGGVAHRVDERDGRAAAAQRRVVRRGRDVRVAGDVHRRARLGEDVEPADVVLGVHLHDLLARRGGEGVEADEQPARASGVRLAAARASRMAGTRRLDSGCPSRVCSIAGDDA